MVRNDALDPRLTGCFKAMLQEPLCQELSAFEYRHAVLMIQCANQEGDLTRILRPKIGQARE